MQAARWVAVLVVVAWAMLTLKTVLPTTLARDPYALPNGQYVPLSSTDQERASVMGMVLRFCRELVAGMVVDQ